LLTLENAEKTGESYSKVPFFALTKTAINDEGAIAGWDGVKNTYKS
jgi:hypothetical protein